MVAFRLKLGSVFRGKRGDEALSAVRYFDEDAIEMTAQIASDLMARGERLSEGDLLVAGISMRHGEEVVTRDRGFGRVRGLSVRFYE